VNLRFLNESEALAALRRGANIEQALPDRSPVGSFSWLSGTPAADTIVLTEQSRFWALGADGR
jgi:hypothetical protein